MSDYDDEEALSAEQFAYINERLNLQLSQRSLRDTTLVRPLMYMLCDEMRPGWRHSSLDLKYYEPEPTEEELLTIRAYKTMKAIFLCPGGGMILAFDHMLWLHPTICQEFLNGLLATCIDIMRLEENTPWRYRRESKIEPLKGIFDEPFEDCLKKYGEEREKGLRDSWLLTLLRRDTLDAFLRKKYLKRIEKRRLAYLAAETTAKGDAQTDAPEPAPESAPESAPDD